MHWIVLGIIISYSLGSIPTAYIFGRILKGVDIRKFGSGNVGATNAMRLLGKGPGVTVLLLDILKGFIAVSLLGNLLFPKIVLISEEFFRITLGLACIAGHNWTVFLGFKGGKGIATTLGVLLGLSLKIAGLKLVILFALLTWLAVFLAVRIVSIASVLTAVAVPGYMFLLKQSRMLISLSVLLCLFILVRHKSNLRRFFKKEEPRLKF